MTPRHEQLVNRRFFYALAIAAVSIPLDEFWPAVAMIAAVIGFSGMLVCVAYWMVDEWDGERGSHD